MNKIQSVRAEAIRTCLEKSSSGKISWTYNRTDRSAQTSFSKFSMHIDLKKEGNKEVVKVWMFDEAGKSIDYFSVSDDAISKSQDPLNEFYGDLVKLVREAATEEKVKSMDPFLSSLKDL